ncbi:3-hydroxylacyl-ACP dehydratase [Magnetospirillum sp. UT-4]|uniref:ApeP family dehydratase n=1 Tax=Magnetospirillum sp. UT-4 TaxID=2681467 RepID=UPI001382A203|nr:3-hydroxylacyl-ACP dehydratase [Magnetospirillum sp. UT-4]CAA7626545.1 3-hydroxylacyl-(Acyl carrier protein) dehydratase [Magnetospirillum sp. UT-4]
MTPCPWSVAELLPHVPPMLLLERVLDYDAEAVTALADTGPDNPFMTARGLPAHVGIELMAQACGAWVGAAALEAGEPVRLGYLLGTRRYLAETEWFPPGEALEIAVRVVFRDQGMGVFDCSLTAGGQVLATAQLTLYQPEETP